MSYFCLHIPLSLLLLCSFSHACCTQITMHGFSFELIFPKWEQKWVFSLLLGGTISGAAADLRRWQPCCVFSGQGAVRYSVWHALSSSWDRPKSTLATRAQFYPHVHTPTAWSRSEAASWQGYRVQAPMARKFLPLASMVLTICFTQDHRVWAVKYSSFFHKLNWKIPDRKHILRRRKCSKLCIPTLHKSWTGRPKYGKRETKTAQAGACVGVCVCVHMGVKYTFTLAWLLEPQSKSDVAGSGKFTQSYERQYRSNCKARMGPRINNHPQNV